ncbi:MAG: hypothetical protein Kow0080_12230 [Candidatus Promineifilaceae bacterium]
MKKIPLTIIILLLLTMFVGTASAAPLSDTVIKSGETIDNDVTVLDGDLEIEEGATVNGDVAVFSGNLVIAGTVRGDVVVFSGDLEAAETAVIRGDCVVLSGEIQDDTARGLNCTSVQGLKVPEFIPPIVDFSVNGPNAAVRQSSPIGHFLGQLAYTIARSVIMGLLALFAAILAPTQLRQIEQTMTKQPFASGVIGTLTSISVPFIIVVLALLSGVLVLACGLGLLGLPVVFALSVAFALAALLGWIAAGHLLGEKVSRMTNLQSVSMPAVAAIGTAVMTFVIGLLGIVSFGFLEMALTGLVGLVGMGAVALTLFGTRPYPPRLAHSANKIAVDADKETAVLDTLPKDDLN